MSWELSKDKQQPMLGVNMRTNRTLSIAPTTDAVLMHVDQRWYCCWIGRGCCQELPWRVCPGHFQPRQLDCPHRGRGPQEAWRLQPQEVRITLLTLQSLFSFLDNLAQSNVLLSHTPLLKSCIWSEQFLLIFGCGDIYGPFFFLFFSVAGIWGSSNLAHHNSEKDSTFFALPQLFSVRCSNGSGKCLKTNKPHLFTLLLAEHQAI